jgi:hypothetical protein
MDTEGFVPKFRVHSKPTPMSKVKVTLFSQLLGLIDRDVFKKAVKKYDCDKHSKGINTWTHLVSMVFLHVANATTLRDISNGLKSATGDLVHMGVKRAPCKSSLSYINANRDYRFFEQLYYDLVHKLEPSLQESKKSLSRIRRKIFIMDSTLIPLSLSLFDWAKYRRNKGAAKLHAVLDYRLGLPTYAVVTNGADTDLGQAQLTSFEKGSVLVIDRIYSDYKWFYKLDSNDISFVIRIKKNVGYQVVGNRELGASDQNVVSDQLIRLTGFKVKKKYPKRLRLVRVFDPKNKVELEILTNNMYWTAATVSNVYRARWDIEVFFKYLKQSIEVKSFVGVSTNAVRIQIWTALIVKLLFSYLKRKARHDWNMSNLVAFLRINLFVKIELWFWLNEPFIKRANSPPEWKLF